MAKNALNDKIVAVVRVRGRVNVRSDIAETLKRLNLPRVNNCAIIKVNGAYTGMLTKCANHVAFGEIDEQTLQKIVAKKLEGSDVDAKQVLEGKYDMKKLNELMPVRLHPPKHGYKSTKLSFAQGGSLGYMGKEINGLIKRMV